jgi:hypothetical protein
MKAYVYEEKHGDIRIKTPYLAAFVEALKVGIPWDDREWRPETKTWIVGVSSAKQAIAITQRFFAEVEIIKFTDQYQQSGFGGSTQAKAADPYATLHLLPTAPIQLIDSAYKCLARMNHPDHGGDTAVMQSINGAYDRLKGARS